MTTILLTALLLSPAAHAVPTPCQFSVFSSSAPSGQAYDIGRAYGAATLVVVGKAEGYVEGAPQTVRVSKVIKGEAAGEIKLEGFHRNGTDSWGAAIPASGEFLMLLSGANVYKWVDPGSGCPNSFEVRENRAVLGKKKIKVVSLKRFLESNPKPIP